MRLDLNDPALLKTQLYIDGRWQNADSGDTLNVVNPADGEILVPVADGGCAETRRAIDSAHRALPQWRGMTARKRSQLLRNWYQLILEHKDDLARIMTLEQGKPLAEAKGEILYGASFIEWFAEEAKRVYGDVIPTVANDRRLLTLKQPIGVVAAITPWNFPSAMLTRKAGPALAVGCTCVLKPAENTPLSAMALVELAHRAGIPAGVLNLVVGQNAPEIGQEMTTNPKVAKITFTGSTAVGKLLLKQCADTVKKASMELGGNAPVLVFDDADLEKAVEGALASKYRNAGQTCICANRLLVQEGIYDRFLERFTERVEQFRLGNGLEPQVTLGPMISPEAVAEVERKVDEALRGGARALTGGRRSELGDSFYQPTVLADATPQMRVFKEEIFGPVAPVFRFKDEAEAIALANATEYGLAAYLYSENHGRIWRVSEALEYGMVGVNEVGITSEVIPFGGVKESGLGREGSKYGVDEYLEIKYICMGGLQDS